MIISTVDPDNPIHKKILFLFLQQLHVGSLFNQDPHTLFCFSRV